MYFNARWVDVSLGKFAQADTMIPQDQGVQAWDRYAYANNDPVRYTDPSGHDPDPWNPFEFNTIVVQVALNVELPLGLNLNLLEFVIDTTAFKEYEFDIYNIKLPQPDLALNVSVTETAGAQVEGAGIGTLYGTNESVDEIVNNNVSSILTEQTLPAHLEVCYEWCFGAGYNFDPADPNWSAGESVSYSVGYGYGVSLGLDLAEARDWIFYYSPETGIRHQRPTRFGEYIREATDDFIELLPE